MKKMAVCITTNLTPGYRHGGLMEQHMFRYYKDKMMKNYLEFDPGIPRDQVDIIIMDSGTKLDEFKQWVDELTKEHLFVKHAHIRNVGGFCAALKHCMHADPAIQDEYEYFFFHVDDGVEPTGDGWAADLIAKYETEENLGIMGRFLDTIRLGPTGLVDHRNCCPHVAKMWGITDIETIPHLHGDWWFMNSSTLKALAGIWWNPLQSQEAMDYQLKWEAIDYQDLVRLNDRRKTLDDVHIGRETDTALRVTRGLGLNLATYDGDLILAKQLHHRF